MPIHIALPAMPPTMAVPFFWHSQPFLLTVLSMESVACFSFRMPILGIGNNQWAQHLEKLFERFAKKKCWENFKPKKSIYVENHEIGIFCGWKKWANLKPFMGPQIGCNSVRQTNDVFSAIVISKRSRLHPGRLTWNLQITHLERKMIFQTTMIMFHVNLQGCNRERFGEFPSRFLRTSW